MGREIRRVPKDWKHPTFADKGIPVPYRNCTDQVFYPMYDEPLNEEELRKDFTVEEILNGYYERAKASYRPAWEEGEATHYQMYENTSEGTPVSPVFETLEELEDWLVEDGTWAPREDPHTNPKLKHIYREPRISRAAAQRFCYSGWAPSMMSVGNTAFRGVEFHEVKHHESD